jgi:hypothetical protein
VLVGGVAFAAFGAKTGDIGSIVFQLCLYQPMLVEFLAGYLAPRGSYLFGGAIGLLSSVVFYGLVLTMHTDLLGTQTLAVSDAALGLISYAVMQTFTGAVFAGFAAWYRDFLKRTSAQSRRRTEEREKLKRKEARRPAPPAVAARKTGR